MMQLWVDENRNIYQLGPDEPLAALEILCGTCWKAGRGDRRLALVATSTKPDAIPVILTRVFRTPDGDAANLWRGEAGNRRLGVACGMKAGRGGKTSGGCPNKRDLPRAWIVEQITAIAVPGTRTIGRIYR